MASVRVRSFSAALSLMKSHLQGEERRRALAKLALQAGNEAAAKNRSALGMDVDQDTIVDGRRGAPVASVKAGGTVVHLFAVQQAAVVYTRDVLIGLSPVDYIDPDDIVYRDHHRMLVNGEDVEPGYSVRPDDVVTFVNLLAYSRRLEKGHSDQAPDGVYEVASEIVRARFGSIVNIRFSYGSFVGGGAGDQRYPMIELKPKRRRV